MSQKRLMITVLAAVVVLLLAVVGVLGWKYMQASKDTTAKDKETSAKIVGKVSRLFEVPANEEPTVALIQDRSKLDNQEFFKKARDGDYLIIYQKEKIALVYREESNKLVNVGPVNLQDPEETDGQEDQQGQTAGEQTEKRTP